MPCLLYEVLSVSLLMSSQKFYNASAPAAFIAGKADVRDDEDLVEPDEEYLPSLQQTYWSKIEKSKDQIDSRISQYMTYYNALCTILTFL